MFPAVEVQSLNQWTAREVSMLIILIVIMVSNTHLKMYQIIHLKCLYIIVCQLYLNKAAAAAKSLQSCPTLCDPRDGSPPGSPVPGILQARTLEWVAISFSNA